MTKSNVLEYKDYTSFIHYSADDKCLYGKIEGIRSLVLFDNEETDIESAFHEAVDSYIADCIAQGSEPEKPYKGQFNVRIKPELHRRIAIRANNDHVSLNHAVEKAIAEYA